MTHALKHLGRQALAVAALALAASGAAFAQSKTEKLGILMPEPHGHTFRLLYVGIEKGWFAAEGLDLEFMVVPGGAVNIVPQLARGQGDVAWAGGYTIIQARARNAPVVAIHSASTESLWGLITRAEDNIRKPQDLKGKTLGVVAFSSATHFMTLGFLEAGGLAEADANLRPIGLGGPAMLGQNQIDGYLWFKSLGVRSKRGDSRSTCLTPTNSSACRRT
jgi:NitT/TauT family transport system substrate-binding protein